jgi:predicted helicase
MNKKTKTALEYNQMIALKNKIQKEAIAAAISEFELAKQEGRAPKATINLATGAGKTRTAWKLIFENDQFQTILFMVPKQSLVDQSIDEFEEQGVEFDYCTVYTNGNVKDVNSLHAFLAQPTNNKKVVFAVYNSVGITEDKTSIFNESDFVFDLAIYDECHRVAGKEMGQFTSCVTDEIVKAHHKLFMTATVKFYLESEDDEDLNEFSMKNENIFGKIVYSITVFEAIEMGILCNFETYLLEVSDDHIRKALTKKVMFYDCEAKGQHVATFYGVLNAYNQGARKIVVMYREIADANDFTRLFQYLQSAEGMFEGAVIGSVASNVTRHELGAPYQYTNQSGKFTVIGNNKRKAQQWWLKQGPFCESESAIAVSTPWIKEGEDVPCIDCIVFGDRFASPIDIIQIIGRALRWYPGKNIARIILPIMEGESNRVAMAIQATIGSLQEKVDDFQITHIEHVNENTPDPANGQNEEETETNDSTPREARWIFTEDQDGMTTLVTNGQMSISVIHSSTSSDLTRLEHEQMMQNIGLKVSNRFREYLRSQRAEKFINEQISLINENIEGFATKNTEKRKIKSNQTYFEMYAEKYGLSIDETAQELAKYMPKIENLRNNFLQSMFQF